MKVIVRLRLAKAAGGGGRNGPGMSAMSLSALIHAVCAAAIFTSGGAPAEKPTTLYTQLIAPQEKKIVWYPLRELPRVIPAENTANSLPTQALERRSQTIISLDPNANPGKQLLWRPDTDKKIAEEIPAPNLISVESTAKSPKPVFRPPEPAPSRVTEKPVEVSPGPSVQTAATLSPSLPGVLASMPKPNRLAVTLPPEAVRKDNPSLTVEAPAASGPLRAGSSAVESLIGGNSVKPTRQAFVPPTHTGGGGKEGSAAHPNLSEVDVGAPTSGGVNAMVLNADAINKVLATIPEGSRPVQMSGAPIQGATASTNGRGPGLRVPGVMVEGKGAAPGVSATAGNAVPKPPDPSIPRKTVYEEARLTVHRTGLSAPLRPAARIIPQRVEARFHERVVYTILIPKPLVSAYAGDWVIWFAEKQPKPGNAPTVRAPQPLRKLGTDDPAPIYPAGRVQFSANILKNGQLDAIAVMSGATDDAAQTVIRDLGSWQFAPALRDGEAVEVEVILEIPFQSVNHPISTGIARH